jgi:hypothetical protein
MITGFDVKNAMHRSFGISKPIEPEPVSLSLVARVVARLRANAGAIFSL